MSGVRCCVCCRRFEPRTRHPAGRNCFFAGGPPEGGVRCSTCAACARRSCLPVGPDQCPVGHGSDAVAPPIEDVGQWDNPPPPPNSIPPPNTIPPQILYPPWLNKRFAKYYTPFSSHTSKRNTNRFGTRSQHHCIVAHLKKAVIVVCLFTLETLLEAWATAAEDAAPAPPAPVTHTSAKASSYPPNSIPPWPY